MDWPEVKQAEEEHRYELVLTGAEVADRIDKNGLDKGVFKLNFLNFLQVSNTRLDSLPEEVGSLVNLRTLDLHRNSIKGLPDSLGLLKELKYLDISGNELQLLPSTVGELVQLQTLNLNCNKLTVLPSLEKLKCLSKLDASYNELTELPDGIYELEHLAEIHASHNKIVAIKKAISKMSVLKVLDLTGNKVEVVPSELSECHKLKDLHLQDNCIIDSRLAKLIKQCPTKAVLDYIVVGNEKVKGKKGGKKGRNKRVSEGDKEEKSAEVKAGAPVGPVVRVLYSDEFKVAVKSGVQGIRPYIVCALLRNLDLSDVAAFKKFISIQTKLHETVCDQRTLATVATHDLSSLTFPLEYDAAPPGDIHLVPLGRHKEMSAEQLISDLRTDAMKQKQKTKRNPFKSGLYKYLTLVEGNSLYAVLKDSTSAVISLPPITNSERSRIKAARLNVLLEVTSPVDLATCKSVMDTLISRMLEAGLRSAQDTHASHSDGAASAAVLTSSESQELVIEQVRVVTSEGQLKVVYPSRVDLQLDSLTVVHQGVD